MRWSILLVLICNKNSNSEKWSYYDISTTYYLLPPFLFKIWKGWDVWMWVGFSRDDFEFASSCTFSTRHRFLLQTCSNIVTLILGCSSLRPTTNRSLSFYCDNIVVQRRLERNILTVRSSQLITHGQISVTSDWFILRYVDSWFDRRIHQVKKKN